MHINHWLSTILFAVILLSPASLQAQTSACKDTAKHIRLRNAMWASCNQDDPKVTYAACWDFQEHAIEDHDNEAYYNAWICGVMYNLDRMNIHDAYHITQTMREDIERQGDKVKEELFLGPKTLGQVYNTCGNIPGARAEFKKAVELIKGTRYEADGLKSLYLGLAHIQLNHDLDETLYWIEEDLKELSCHQNLPYYYAGLADAYAIKAIVKFKQRNYDEFRQCAELAEEANRNNPQPVGDLFLNYARIYKTLLDGRTEEALAAVDSVASLKEQYLLKCDIYRYIGDNEKAYLTQRELMHKRDSITGVMIAENIEKQENEIQLMKAQQKSAYITTCVLIAVLVLAVLFILLLHRNIFLRRRYNKHLKAKNEELEEANRHVMAADQMKTDFIRSVSHEIRTPLNIINGFSQVITSDEDTFNPQERHDIAATISQNTRQITSLVNKMLALANNSTKDLLKEVEPTNVLDICRNALDGIPKTDPTQIKVVFEDLTEGWDHIVCTNSDSLLQMLGNLLENAVKFTEKGHIRLTLSSDATNCHFTVEDTGCGISEEDAKHIFERFTKVDEFKEGLGLGLAYCHETTQKLGGTLTLDPDYHQGARFVLTLPIKQLTS